MEGGLDVLFAMVAIPFILISSIVVFFDGREPKEPKTVKMA